MLLALRALSAAAAGWTTYDFQSGHLPPQAPPEITIHTDTITHQVSPAVH